MHNASTEYKQMHKKTISWNDNEILIFICFVGRLLLDPSASSSYSFMTSSFLIQMLIWIRCSSRVESFIFLITWGIFFESWEIELQLISSSLLFFIIRASSCVHSSQSLLKVITSFRHTFLEWMSPMILGGHSRWL